MNRLKRIQRRQLLPLTLSEAWSFFSNPRNLCLITPRWLCLSVTGPEPRPMYAGQILEYEVRPFPGLRTGWVTEITQVRPPRFFVDEQRLGPYRFWHHQHLFCPSGDGVEMTDTVHYALPFGALGDLAAPLVARRLEAIFDHRRRALRERFPS